VHPPDQEKGPDSVGAEIRAGGIKDLSLRLDRYKKAKLRSLDVSKYMGEVMHHQQAHITELFRDTIRATQSCGNYLQFRHYFTVDKVRLHAASLCKRHLLCPLCAIRRGAKALGAYSDRWKVIRAVNPRLRPFMVTLTVKDGADLDERFRHLHKSQRELWKRKQRERGSVLDGVVGAVWSYEFKRGANSGLWHPHLHMIALAESQPDQQALRDEWHNITGDSYIVDVRPIEHDAGDAHINGFLEVFKYAVKFSDQDPADTVHAWLTLKGRNLIGSAGCFRGVDVPESLLDEPLDDLPYVEYFYTWSAGRYRAPVGSRVASVDLAA
jgi:Replication protein